MISSVILNPHVQSVYFALILMHVLIISSCLWHNKLWQWQSIFQKLYCWQTSSSRQII